MDSKSWHVCNDCLSPLADELHSLAQRFHRVFNVKRRDQLNCEYEAITKSVWYDYSQLTNEQRKRLDELSEQIRSQIEPPCPRDVDDMYRKYNVAMAIDWLRLNVSVDYAEDLKRLLVDAKKRFVALDFKANQIINGDIGNETTIQVNYAIQRLIDRHYELLREEFPDGDGYPERESMPDDLRAVEVEIIDEYVYIEKDLIAVAARLKRTCELLVSRSDLTLNPASQNGNHELIGAPHGVIDATTQQCDAWLIAQWEKGATLKSILRSFQLPSRQQWGPPAGESGLRQRLDAAYGRVKGTRYPRRQQGRRPGK